MKERRNNSNRASILQIALSAGLISISAILLTIAAPINVSTNANFNGTFAASPPNGEVAVTRNRFARLNHVFTNRENSYEKTTRFEICLF
jgi:hypothetical protein